MTRASGSHLSRINRRRGPDLASIAVWEVLDDLFEDRIIKWSLADVRPCAWIMEEKRRRKEALKDFDSNSLIVYDTGTDPTSSAMA